MKAESSAPGAVNAMVYAVAFLSGAALMGLEMVGSRILAPVFGSSIFVWGSLIGVVLTALSVGYYAGGYLSDRHPHAGWLSLLLALAGAWTSFIPALSRRTLPRLASTFPGISGPFLSSFALFFMPSVLLAMVSPWCVRLLVRSVERAGRSAGLLYAISNAGSILGTFATAFFLIPRIGTESIIRWTSAALLGLALLLAWGGKSRRMGATVLALALAVLAAGVFFGAAGEKGIVYEAQSLYHHIFVVDQGNVRLLRFDQAVQGGMYLDRPYESAYPYPDYFHLALTMKDDIKDVLMIGLGAGMAPKRFQRDYPDMRIDVVEIDPEVVKVASKYFGFPGDDNLRVFVKDGRMFLKDTQKKYDLIMVDAYYADAVPFHLTTVEFYELVKQRLKPGGVLASNMIGALEGQRSKLFRSMHMTLSRVFPATYVFPLDNRPGTEGRYRNIEVFAVLPPESSGGEVAPARMTRQDFQAKARTLAQSRVTVAGLVRIAGDLYEKALDKEGAVLLTDDHAPVDSLLHLY
jgi:spermidine synthase